MEVLENVEKRRSYSNIELDSALKRNHLIPSDAGLLTELVYGVTQRKYTLDYYLEPFIRQPEEVEGWVRQLLRLSVYQFAYLDKVPSHALVNEAVEIAKFKGHEGTAGFINAVLRSVQRKGLRSFEDISNPITRLSIQYSAPEWMIQKFTDEIGLTETEKLFSSLLTKSKASVRVNTQINTVEQAKEKLESEGFESSLSKISPVGLVSGSGHFASTSLFKEGGITIQDETSMLVAPAMQIQPNHHVLDACAAPGGKTMHIATYLSKEKGGNVTALDLHEKKLKLIIANAERLHVEHVVDMTAIDARKAAETFSTGTFDRILVDAPCSGLGLMRRKPDIKYTKTAEDIVQLAKVQGEILEAVSKCLKPEGLLVYSTCTITPEENEQVIAGFLENNPSFEAVDVYAPHLDAKNIKNGMVKIYPHNEQTDGFFIACLKKLAE